MSTIPGRWQLELRVRSPCAASFLAAGRAFFPRGSLLSKAKQSQNVWREDSALIGGEILVERLVCQPKSPEKERESAAPPTIVVVVK